MYELTVYELTIPNLYITIKQFSKSMSIIKSQCQSYHYPHIMH